MKAWKDYGERVARGDFIALVDRGQDYVVHAARYYDGRFTTACGRILFSPNEVDNGEITYVSCRNCLRVLPK